MTNIHSAVHAVTHCQNVHHKLVSTALKWLTELSCFLALVLHLAYPTL